MKIDTRLEELGDRLERSVAADLRNEQRGAGAAARWGRRRTRPRLLAGSTLGLAGVGAALVLALGGTATTSPAYAITQKGDGSVLIKFNPTFAGPHTLAEADAKLRADYDETILVNEAPGPATVKVAMNCTPVKGLDAGAKTPVKVLLGKDGTGMIPAGNTGAGIVHLTGCYLYNDAGPSNTGSTGNS
jgi:hypothetical protein